MKTRKLLSVLLVICMILSIVPMMGIRVCAVDEEPISITINKSSNGKVEIANTNVAGVPEYPVYLRITPDDGFQLATLTVTASDGNELETEILTGSTSEQEYNGCC